MDVNISARVKEGNKGSSGLCVCEPRCFLTETAQ